MRESEVDGDGGAVGFERGDEAGEDRDDHDDKPV